jgi:hypothetical protein
MFGLFKKQVTSEEFGHVLFEMTWDFVATDCGRALGTAMFDDFNASGGVGEFFAGKGIPLEKQKLHFCLYAHCTIQAGCTLLPEATRRPVTHGAISGRYSTPDYDFDNTYATLEAAYRGQHKFSRTVESLTNPNTQLAWLPNPNAGVLNAKYLIDSFVIPHTANSKVLIKNFDRYSSPVCASIATVRRAMAHLFTKVKI